MGAEEFGPAEPTAAQSVTQVATDVVGKTGVSMMSNVVWYVGLVALIYVGYQVYQGQE